MCVLPSLSVAASVLPSYSRRGEYVLSLEATNYRSNGDDVSDNKHLRIHKVCVGCWGERGGENASFFVSCNVSYSWSWSWWSSLLLLSSSPPMA